MSNPIIFRKEDLEYGFLSNFHPSPIRYTDNHVYPTAEHLYQTLKTLDEGERQIIRACRTPNDARKMGRQITLRPGWEDIKIIEMATVVLMKFNQNPPLWEKLMKTGDRPLVEWAPWDGFWGTGRDGKGLNVLGKLLVKVRESYQSGATFKLDVPEILGQGAGVKETASMETRWVHIRSGKPYDFYVGRSREGMHFGNPFSHQQGTLAQLKTNTREEAIQAFAQWLKGTAFTNVEPERRAWILQKLPMLKGKTLGCFCAPLDCHARILLEMAEDDDAKQ
jgi:ribA/ribD-fused uncharacterized protein